MIPNLPTDSIYKFLCFGGLALMIYCFIGIDSMTGKALGMSENTRQEELDFVMSITEGSPGFFSNKENMALLDSLRLMNGQILDTKLKTLEVKESLLTDLLFVGAGLFIMGFLFWEKSQNKLDKITGNEAEKAERQYTVCQSCSAPFQLAEISAGKIYCSYCFDGSSFTEPDMRLDDMEKRVRKQLKRQNASTFAVWIGGRKIKHLYRWNTLLKWDFGRVQDETGQI